MSAAARLWLWVKRNVTLQRGPSTKENLKWKLLQSSPSSSMCNVTSLKTPFSTSKETRQSRKYVAIATRSPILDFTQTFAMLASSGLQILSHLLKTACDLHTPCTPCPYFHLCSWTKIWREKSSLRVLLRVLDGDCLGLKIGESSLWTKLPACSRLLETSERCLKKQNLGHMDKPFCV